MPAAAKSPSTPAGARPQRSDARRNREKVIRAARRIMARDGLDAQIDEIAAAAKVGVGTVYRHFPTKEKLVDGLAEERFERLAELAREALEVGDPWEGFAGFMRAAGKIQSEDRALSEVLTSRPGTMRRAAEGAGIPALVTELIERAQASGAVRPDAEPEDVPMVMCALAGACGNPMTDPERYMGIVLDGLRGPAATPEQGRLRRRSADRRF